ncbi:hypothetical protein [Mucilaginibacter aquariorum]|uniref:Uncharacterized protein n=1 Tax=Mucilaginibacter aquariorum TaxID=2967225 RepID=A0ABT1T856_9SPHI|nr:hypothetical protein [Mucilaginibacter aquariorum]MCQ6960113.1 hypothetical protein [Mucilaginibacter aquariorum]
MLQIKAHQLHRATQQQILDNPGDVAIGVNQVEVVLGHTFFNLFGSLVIKHHDDGELRLMFNQTSFDADQVAALYWELKTHFGQGIHHQPNFSSFEDLQKIRSIAQKKYDGPNDEIWHYWSAGRFGFVLNYKIEPLGQLLFSVTNRPEKVADVKIRDKGTLLQLLQHNITELFGTEENFSIPIIENGEVKFTDYVFHVDPPELRIFNTVKIRVLGTERSLTNVKSLLVNYQTDNTWEIRDVILLVDALLKIYGPDDTGYAELQPHEIDNIEQESYWTGRSWLINQDHGLQDLGDTSQQTLYWINLNMNPEDGLNLSILGFDHMEAYQNIY